MTSLRFVIPTTVLAALVSICLCLGAGSAAASGFTPCGPKQKLENNGIFNLKAKNASCKVARQVAYARRGGDTSPKGYTCMTGPGGNLTPYTCVRTASIVKFFLEG
jgi:hypothetical protein